MHAIKRKARHIAHRRDDDEYGRLARYIPFAKQFTPPPSQHGDPESGRRASEHSTGCIEDSAEADRRGNNQPHVNHASTMPVSPTDYEEKREQSDRSLVAESPSSTGVAGSQPTRRRRLGGLLGRDTRPGIERSTSSRSRRTLVNQKFPFWQQMKAIFWSPVNILLIAVPIGIAFGAINEQRGFNSVAVFVVNFIAIIPLAGLLSYATEEVAMRVGETLGGLLNASFGNAVELITAIIALKENQITIVKTSLIGSMLSNLLLVLGMCFLFGGIGRDVQHFNVQVAQTAASLLALAVGSLLIPTFFDQGATTGAPPQLVPPLSHGVAVVLFVVYGAYLYFQLSTHKDTYNKPSEKSPKKSEGVALGRGIAMIGAGNAAVPGAQVFQKEAEDDEIEQPRIHIITAVLLLTLSTAFVGVCSEFLVDAIPAITDNSAISKEFVGLILLPIVGNAAEHATAVTVAIKDKMDLAIGVAIGSSLQIVLLVLPLVTIIGWGLHNDGMTLEFDVFLIGLLFVSILLVNYLIGDGESHWLEGVMLIAMYILIAVAAWFYPAPPGTV